LPRPQRFTSRLQDSNIAEPHPRQIPDVEAARSDKTGALN
jgi:hypothetical protein